MKKYVALLFLVFVSCSAFHTAFAANSLNISVSVDPRVEVMSIIFRLAKAEEYLEGQVKGYLQDTDRYFSAFRTHPVIGFVKKIRQDHGVSFDAPMSLAVHVLDAGSFQPRVPFSPRPHGLDNRWSPPEAEEFCSLARDFVKKSNFQHFFASHASLFDSAVAKMKALLEKQAHLEWFDEFFGKSDSGGFHVIVAMNNGPANYSAEVEMPAGKEIYSFIGVYTCDEADCPVFDQRILATIIHEFSHSFANPLVYNQRAVWQKVGKRLFQHVRDEMTSQAYGDWETMICESLVRASVVCYLRKNSSEEDALQAIQTDEQKGFLWIMELAAFLERYEKNRKTYPTLQSFVPELVGFFGRYERQFASDLQNRPKIVSLNPPNGANAVNPKITEIQVTFDSPMKSSFAWCGGDTFPPAPSGSKAYWTADRKTCVLPVYLAAETTYGISLNAVGALGFKNEKGVPLLPTEWSFRTGK